MNLELSPQKSLTHASPNLRLKDACNSECDHFQLIQQANFAEGLEVLVGLSPEIPDPVHQRYAMHSPLLFIGAHISTTQINLDCAADATALIL